MHFNLTVINECLFSRDCELGAGDVMIFYAHCQPQPLNIYYLPFIVLMRMLEMLAVSFTH